MTEPLGAGFEVGVPSLPDVAPDEPTSWSLVIGPDVASTYHERPAGVAECFQRSEHGVSSPSSEISAVLKSKPTRAALSDDADGFEEEARPFTFDASPFGVGAADVLARGGANDDGRKSSEIMQKSLCRESADIIVDMYPRIILRVEGAAPLDGFAGGDGAKACAVHPERPPAGRRAEQVEDFHHLLPPFRPISSP